jgi:hypothetical protein
MQDQSIGGILDAGGAATRQPARYQQHERKALDDMYQCRAALSIEMCV